MGPAETPRSSALFVQLAFLLSKKCTSRISRRPRFRNDRALQFSAILPAISFFFFLSFGAPSSENYVSVLAFSVHKSQKRVMTSGDCRRCVAEHMSIFQERHSFFVVRSEKI